MLSLALRLESLLTSLPIDPFGYATETRLSFNCSILAIIYDLSFIDAFSDCCSTLLGLYVHMTDWLIDDLLLGLLLWGRPS